MEMGACTKCEAQDARVVLRITQDADPVNPREWDNLGTMVCWHRRYDLGDEHHYSSPDDFSKEINDRNAIILPLYLYDHSILRMDTRSWIGRAHHADWDSGQVGYIYVTRERVRREYGVNRVTKKVRERVEEVLRAEVQTYDQYLTGDVYGYEVVKVVECPECGESREEVLDSCWGFYGDNPQENGMAECISAKYQHLLAEAEYV